MKKIAILGKMKTKYEAPFDDNNWEIWAFNLHKDEARIPRVDKWFDLHPYAYQWKNRDYTLRNFPFEECEKLVGGQYFNNSLSYLIAFAILEGATEIRLYGCRFENGETERESEFVNVRELLFFAKGRGVKVSAPADKRMLRPWYKYIDWRKYKGE